MHSWSRCAFPAAANTRAALPVHSRMERNFLGIPANPPRNWAALGVSLSRALPLRRSRQVSFAHCELEDCSFKDATLIGCSFLESKFTGTHVSFDVGVAPRCPAKRAGSPRRSWGPAGMRVLSGTAVLARECTERGAH